MPVTGEQPAPLLDQLRIQRDLTKRELSRCNALVLPLFFRVFRLWLCMLLILLGPFAFVSELRRFDFAAVPTNVWAIMGGALAGLVALHFVTRQMVAARALAAATELEIRLITGRTHQIRATAAHFHAPVIGATLYGNDEAKFRLYNVGREKKKIIQDAGMLLMAQKLSLKHPFKRKNLNFELELPARFAAVSAALAKISK